MSGDNRTRPWAEPTLSEQAIADRYGVTRMTVRKALAKG